MYNEFDVPEEMCICSWCEYWGEERLEKDVCSCSLVGEQAEVRGVCHVFTHASASCPNFQPSGECVDSCPHSYAEEERYSGLRPGVDFPFTL